MKLKKIEVTFAQTSKYNEVERTNLIEAENQNHAELLLHQKYGSFTTETNDFGMMFNVPSNKVRIIKTIEVKESK